MANKMNIYLVKRTDYDEDHMPYDEYEGFVAIAESEEAVRFLLPGVNKRGSDWPDNKYVAVTKIGVSNINEECILLKSFNAG